MSILDDIGAYADKEYLGTRRRERSYLGNVLSRFKEKGGHIPLANINSAPTRQVIPSSFGPPSTQGRDAGAVDKTKGLMAKRREVSLPMKILGMVRKVAFLDSEIGAQDIRPDYRSQERSPDITGEDHRTGPVNQYQGQPPNRGTGNELQNLRSSMADEAANYTTRDATPWGPLEKGTDKVGQIRALPGAIYPGMPYAAAAASLPPRPMVAPPIAPQKLVRPGEEAPGLLGAGGVISALMTAYSLWQARKLRNDFAARKEIDEANAVKYQDALAVYAQRIKHGSSHTKINGPVRKRVELLVYKHTDAGDVKILITRYGKTTNRIFPGGGIDRGESVEQAARREAKEEVGVSVDRIVPVGLSPINSAWSIKAVAKAKTRGRHYKGDRTYYRSAAYRGRDMSLYGEDGDQSKPEWVEVSSLLRLLNKEILECKDDYNDHRKGRVRALRLLRIKLDKAHVKCSSYMDLIPSIIPLDSGGDGGVEIAGIGFPSYEDRYEDVPRDKISQDLGSAGEYSVTMGDNAPSLSVQPGSEESHPETSRRGLLGTQRSDRSMDTSELNSNIRSLANSDVYA